MKELHLFIFTYSSSLIHLPLLSIGQATIFSHDILKSSHIQYLEALLFPFSSILFTTPQPRIPPVLRCPESNTSARDWNKAAMVSVQKLSVLAYSLNWHFLVMHACLTTYSCDLVLVPQSSSSPATILSNSLLKSPAHAHVLSFKLLRDNRSVPCIDGAPR